MEFRESEAIQYGVNEAIMIQNFRYWINKNKANGKHEHEGKTWTYNSNKAFNEIFKFWSEKQIRTILKSLEDKNVIQTGNFNKKGFDRTKWYSFVDEERFLSIGSNGQMHLTKWANGIAQMGEPIPDSIPYSIPNNKKEKYIKKKKFIIPTVEEIEKYCKERNNNVDAEVFYDFYESKGWLVGKTPMKDWKAAVRTWERNRTGNTSPKPQKESKPFYECVNPEAINMSYSDEDWEAQQIWTI